MKASILYCWPSNFFCFCFISLSDQQMKTIRMWNGNSVLSTYNYSSFRHLNHDESVATSVQFKLQDVPVYNLRCQSQYTHLCIACFHYVIREREKKDPQIHKNSYTNKNTKYLNEFFFSRLLLLPFCVILG